MNPLVETTNLVTTTYLDVGILGFCPNDVTRTNGLFDGKTTGQNQLVIGWVDKCECHECLLGNGVRSIPLGAKPPCIRNTQGIEDVR